MRYITHGWCNGCVERYEIRKWNLTSIFAGSAPVWDFPRAISENHSVCRIYDLQLGLGRQQEHHESGSYGVACALSRIFHVAEMSASIYRDIGVSRRSEHSISFSPYFLNTGRLSSWPARRHGYSQNTRHVHTHVFQRRVAMANMKMARRKRSCSPAGEDPTHPDGRAWSENSFKASRASFPVCSIPHETPKT